MESVNQTRPHSVNQMGKTHSKPLAARHGRGTAWERHAMCESALKRQIDVLEKYFQFPKEISLHECGSISAPNKILCFLQMAF